MDTDLISSLNKNGSGLKLSELTTSLVSAEITPQKSRLENQMEDTEASISALAELKASLGDTRQAIEDLGSVRVLSAQSNVYEVDVAITDPNAVEQGDTAMIVEQIAARQVLEFQGFTSADDVIGDGDLNIEFGEWATDGTFTANSERAAKSLSFGTDASLSDIATALNDLEGVTARVLDRGDGTFTLGIVSDLGADNALRVTATPTDPLAPSRLVEFDTTATNDTVQVQAATDAKIVLDGITVYRETNKVTDLIAGVEVTLNAPTTYPATITTARNSEAARDALKTVVEQVNNVMTQLKSLTSTGFDGTERGDLASDSSVRRLMTELRSLVTQPLDGLAERPVYLSDFGVSTQRDGSLTLNDSLFDRAFRNRPELFDGLTSNVLRSEQEGVAVFGIPMDSAVSGTYNLVVDQTTGAGTLGGFPTLATPLENGGTQYLALSGPMAGLMVQVEAGITEAEVTFGRSLTSTLEAHFNEILAPDGALERRDRQLNDLIDGYTEDLEALDARSLELEERYTLKFAAMENAITQLKSTGEYLSNMIAAWNKDS